MMIFATCAVLALAVLGASLVRTVTIHVDGMTLAIHTLATNPGWALHDAGVTLHPADAVSPALASPLGWQAAIEVNRARQVNLYAAGMAPVTIYSASRVPADLLKEAGLTLQPDDSLLWDGQVMDLNQPLPDAPQYDFQVAPGHQVTVICNNINRDVSTSGATLGAGLWAAGQMVSPVDLLSAPYTTSLGQQASISVKLAAPISVQVDGKTITGKSAAATVGDALAELGISLQSLDESVPAESQPVPADGTIKVVRVREEIVLDETKTPFKSELVPDSSIELDQSRVVQAGQNGIKVTRTRVRYEDGLEVSRTNEGEWVASQPRNQKIGYGTKVVIHTLDTPDGQIQYYRAVRVYATSFAPCNFIQFIGHCSYTTANGMTLQKGVIGVGEAWYRLFKNQRVYVENYGPATVADYGYVPGYWIDLGYSDADFVNWHGYTTLYFLAPAPANVPWTLPK